MSAPYTDSCMFFWVPVFPRKIEIRTVADSVSGNLTICLVRVNSMGYARRTQLQCVSNGVMSFLHKPIKLQMVWQLLNPLHAWLVTVKKIAYNLLQFIGAISPKIFHIWQYGLKQFPSLTCPPVGSGTPAFRLGSRIDPHRHRGVVKVHWRVPWVGGLFSWVVATFTL